MRKDPHDQEGIVKALRPFLIKLEEGLKFASTTHDSFRRDERAKGGIVDICNVTDGWIYHDQVSNFIRNNIVGENVLFQENGLFKCLVIRLPEYDSTICLKWHMLNRRNQPTKGSSDRIDAFYNQGNILPGIVEGFSVNVILGYKKDPAGFGLLIEKTRLLCYQKKRHQLWSVPVFDLGGEITEQLGLPNYPTPTTQVSTKRVKVKGNQDVKEA